MNKKILTKVLATMLVMTLTLANFMLLGVYASKAYATGNELENQGIQTNNSNVEFDVYWKDEKGNNTHSITQSMKKEDLKLYLSVHVNKGYLKNAQIQIMGENNTQANFQIVNSNQSLELIEKIESEKNLISLKQLDSGTEVVLELPVTAIKSEHYDISNLSKMNEIRLTGSYINDSGKAIAIDKTIQLRNQWNETVTASIEQQILRYIPYTVAEKTGTILQTLVKTGLDNNGLPIEKTNITIQVPDVNGVRPEQVMVTSNGLDATNGQDGLSFNENNWNYDAQTGILTIETKNEVQDNLVSWNQEGKDEYIITYVFKDKMDTITVAQKAKVVINAYSSIETTVEKENTLTIEQNEKIGDIVSIGITGTDTLSKGSLYTKSDKEIRYDEKVTVDVGYMDLVDQLVIDQNMDYFLNEQNEVSPTTVSDFNYAYYISSKIKKENFEKILGTEGSIKILNKNGEELTTWNKETPVDENGYYITNYANSINQIQIQTSKPITNGKLEIEHSKSLKGNTDYSKKQVESFQFLSMGATVLARASEMTIAQVQAQKNIGLVAPTTKVEVATNTDTLSTVVKNENVEIRVILKTNDITCDLYKNPFVEIVLPNYIKQFELKDINLLFDDELKIKDYDTYVNENGNIVIRVNIQGENTKYNQDTISMGANLVINADITLKQLTPTKQESIKVYITNENVTTYENVESSNARAVVRGYAESGLKAVAPVGMVTTNSITGYNDKDETVTSISGQEQVGKLKAKASQRTATVNMNIINNYENIVKNIVILGRVPAEGNKDFANVELGSNLTTSMQDKIVLQGANDYTIYYSNNIEATKDLSLESNGWTTTVNDIASIRSYLVVLNNKEMATGENIELSYPITILENIDYNKTTYGTYAVYFDNVAATQTLSDKATATKVGLSTGEGPELEVKITSDVTNMANVQEGDIITYQATVKNLGKQAVQNVSLRGVIPEGSNYIYFVGQEGTEDGLEEVQNGDAVECMLIFDTIQPGETKTMKYRVQVQTLDIITDEDGNDILEERVLHAKAYATAKGYEETVFNSNTIENKVIQGYLNFTMTIDVIAPSVPRQEGEEIVYVSQIKNVNSIEKKNVVVTDVLPEGISFKQANNNGTYDSSNRTVTWDLGNLQGDDSVTLQLIVTVDALPNGTYTKQIKNRMKLKTEDKELKTNELTITVNKPALSVKQSSSTQEKVIEGGSIVYNIEVRNVGTSAAENVVIVDDIPDGLLYQGAKYIVNGKTYYSNIGTTQATISIPIIEAGQTAEITITTVASQLADNETQKTVTNKVQIKAKGIATMTPDTITHTIIKNSNGDNEGNNGGGSSSDTPNENNNTRVISGILWNDVNGDGKREDSEERLANHRVLLVNGENGQIVQDATTGEQKIQNTNDKGEYAFTNLKPGKYIVVFFFDTANYEVTLYQKEGVLESKNSDAISMKVELEGQIQRAAVTNAIQVNTLDVTNIDLGLVQSKKFDLRLDKTISKITVTDSKETKVHGYEDTKLAKLDLNPKTLESTNIVIEYKIRVANEGAVAGYAKKVADYIPQGMKFTSELNPDWYTSDNGTIYNSSLATILLQPGETKELTLLLTKNYADGETGLLNNKAEIYEAYNDLGLEDVDSIPANKVQGEDDFSQADAVIGIKTGEVYLYTLLTISIIAIMGVGIYLIKKKVLTKI